MEKIKKFLANPNTKAFAVGFAQGVGQAVLVSLVTLGAITATVLVVSAVEQKLNPEGFKEEWISETQQALEEAQAE